MRGSTFSKSFFPYGKAAYMMLCPTQIKKSEAKRCSPYKRLLG